MKYTPRTSAIVLAAFVFLGMTAVGVQASPTCERLVRQYSEKVIHHPVSKATLARWKAWGAAHPNYHPPTKRAKLTPEETYKKVAYACEVPAGSTQNTLEVPLLPPLEPMVPTELVALNLLPPPVTPVFTLVGTPVSVPAVPVNGETPEPSSIVFLATGLALLAVLRKRFSFTMQREA